MPPSDPLRAVGAYWIQYTAKEGYGDRLRLAGGSFPGFLVVGLIEGLGQLFRIDVRIAPLKLKAAGAAHDTVHVTYAPR